MSIEEVLEAVERILLPKQLDSVEQLVLCQSWLGQTYSEMAESSSYGSDYIKEVGSRLWQELSEALGQRVTKKNLYLVLKGYQSNLQSITSEIVTSNQDDYLLSVTNTNDQKLVTDKCLLPAVTNFLELEFPSGPLPLGSLLYINRPPTEELAYREISRPGCVIRIKASMKMGKSSLLNRIIAHAIAQEKYKTIYIDFQEADEDIFTSLDKFLRWFCANMARQLHLKPKLDDYWDLDMGSKVSCKIYLEGYLLEQIDCSLLLALNEVNRVFEYSHIAQDFLPMLRSWHEQAQQLKVWQKLRLVIVHTTDIYVPLKLSQSPFNIGLSLRLPPFNLEQVRELAQRYGLDWQNEVGIRYVASLLAMVGGHPYLVNLALYHVSQGWMTLEELLLTAPTTGGVYSHYLRSHLAVLREQPQLASILRQIVMANEQVSLDAIAAHKLESMGLIQLDGNWAKPSCELYRLYFREQLRTKYLSDPYPEQLQLGQQAQRYLSNADEN